MSIKIYGEKGGIEWHQMEPNTLIVKYLDKTTQIYRTGVGSLYPETIAHTRLPAGHPEGYIEAFANIYRNFAYCVQANLEGISPDPLYLDFPSIDDGIRGMQFLNKVVESSRSKEKWTKMT